MKKSTIIKVIIGAVGGISAGLAYLNARSSKKYVETFDLNKTLEQCRKVDEMVKNLPSPLEGKVEEVDHVKLTNPDVEISSVDNNLLLNVFMFQRNNLSAGAFVHADGHLSFLDLDDKSVYCVHPKDYQSFDSFKAAVVEQIARVKNESKVTIDEFDNINLNASFKNGWSLWFTKSGLSESGPDFIDSSDAITTMNPSEYKTIEEFRAAFLDTKKRVLLRKAVTDLTKS